jgi:hypothetical protein
MMSFESEEQAVARMLMDRREAIKRVSVMLGGAALVGGSSLFTACAPPDKSTATAAAATDTASTVSNFKAFTPQEIALLDEVADTILPDTKTPGAKAAKTGAFMALMVTDAYAAKDQATFREGMIKLDAASQAANKTTFMAATPAQRLALLEALDKEQKAYMDTRKPDDATHYFRMMKELTLLGYFTSEIGVTKAQRYSETPGRFDPCLPYAKGETSWASHA